VEKLSAGLINFVSSLDESLSFKQALYVPELAEAGSVPPFPEIKVQSKLEPET